MDFFDKIYVGFQRERYNNAETPRLLGFCIPYNETKANKKRQETVNYWRDKDIEPRIMDNVPQRGFKLLEVVSRRSTSNKLFRVLDPRGFELEISADNLLDLARQSTIIKGEIIEECIWAGSGSYLEPVSSDRYKFYMKQKKTGPEKIEVGKYYAAVGNMVSVFRYEGIFHHTHLVLKNTAKRGDLLQKPVGSGYYNQKTFLNIIEYDTHIDVILNSGNKPVNVYTEFRLDSEGNIETKQVHFRKTHFKGLLSYDGDTSEMNKYIPDMTQWVSSENSFYEPDYGKGDQYVSNVPMCYAAFFKTKEEAKSYDYTDIIKQNIANRHPSRVYDFDISAFSGIKVSYGYRSMYDLSPDAIRNIFIIDKR